MFCIKCGVELTDGQTLCPVCGTRVYHPDFPVKEAVPTYPKKDFESEEFNRKGILFVVTIILTLISALAIMFDLSLNGHVTWAGYVAGGLGVFYFCVIMPLWFKRTTPAIFVPVGFSSIILFLLYINLHTGGSWFLSFAFPVAGSLGVIMTAVTSVFHYVQRGRLYTVGGGMIAIGIWTLLIELFIHLTFELPKHIIWSPFPCATFVVFGLMLIVIAIVKPLKDSLKRIFYVGKM
ncbi:MAG: zinc ribbon domain-containing protein [Clostridia bacterium]|nr:zinc ribbon domain-containing protein [Clostridia bacterium]